MHRTVHAVVAVVFSCVAASAAAQDPLAPIRALYGSAEYEQALSAINRIRGEAGISGIEVDRYQVLCLVALGRSDEAKEAIESIVTADPLFQPSAGDAAPSVRAVYSEVRRKVLPGVGRQMYTEAKAAFDRKAFAEALEKFERILRVIDDPDAAGDAALTDLRVVVTGFLDLSKASAAGPPPPPAPSSYEAVVPPPAPVVSEPVVIRQDIPAWTGRMGAGPKIEFRGAIEVVIDEGGSVKGATIIEPIHPLYDSRLVEAARDWKYQPARRDGEPIRTLKRVEIVLRDHQQD
jgi:hypothetical protein